MMATNVGHLIIICNDDDVFHRHHSSSCIIIITSSSRRQKQQKSKTRSKRVQNVHQRARQVTIKSVRPDIRYAPWLTDYLTKSNCKFTRRASLLIFTFTYKSHRIHHNSSSSSQAIIRIKRLASDRPNRGPITNKERNLIRR